MKSIKKYLFPCLFGLLLIVGFTMPVVAAPVDLVYRPDSLDLDMTAIEFFAVGAGLLFLELFIPGFGLCGISGIVCILVSFYFGLGGGKDTIPVLAAGLVGIAVLGALFMKLLPKNPLWQKFVLSNKDHLTGKENHLDLTGYIGKTGTAESLLRPSGVAKINGKIVDVITEGDFIAPGSPVVIVKVEGHKIFVEKEKQQ